jgi:hypothetical protein
MLSEAFIAHKWPQRNSQYVIEQCDVRRISDLPRFRIEGSTATVPFSSAPKVVKIARGHGYSWAFLCPNCSRRVEALYRPPDWEWACRWCHKLVYASQRYGRKNPIRQVQSPRKLLHRGRGKPYLHARILLKVIDRPEPKGMSARFQWAIEGLEAIEALGLLGELGRRTQDK